MFDVTLHQSLFDTSHSLNFILKIYGLGTQVKESFLLIILADSSSSLLSLFSWISHTFIHSFILDSTWGTFFFPFFFIYFLFFIFFILLWWKKKIDFYVAGWDGFGWCWYETDVQEASEKLAFFYIFSVWFLWA